MDFSFVHTIGTLALWRSFVGQCSLVRSPSNHDGKHMARKHHLSPHTPPNLFSPSRVRGKRTPNPYVNRVPHTCDAQSPSPLPTNRNLPNLNTEPASQSTLLNQFQLSRNTMINVQFPPNLLLLLSSRTRG